jgi:hypothetical protein
MRKNQNFIYEEYQFHNTNYIVFHQAVTFANLQRPAFGDEGVLPDETQASFVSYLQSIFYQRGTGQ